MKKNLPPETEQLSGADVNLREALRRRYADEPQLPHGFARKLQHRILAEREKEHASTRLSPWRKWQSVAAIFAGVLLVSGGVLAAVRWGFPRQGSSAEGGTIAAQATTTTEGGDSLTNFRNMPLDSLLAVVATRYRKTVVFVDEEPQALRFSIAWNEAEPLADFLTTVNEFDGLRLTDERDTIFVESVAAEEEEDEP